MDKKLVIDYFTGSKQENQIDIAMRTQTLLSKNELKNRGGKP